MNLFMYCVMMSPINSENRNSQGVETTLGMFGDPFSIRISFLFLANVLDESKLAMSLLATRMSKATISNKMIPNN